MNDIRRLIADDVEENRQNIITGAKVVNPFSSDVRYFKTIFDIRDPEGMMDFGIWILSRCEPCLTPSCSTVDPLIELFYELMRRGVREGEHLCIVVEESFEEVFVTMQLERPLTLMPKAQKLATAFGNRCVIGESTVCVRLDIFGRGKTAGELPAERPVPPVREEPLKAETAKETISMEEVNIEKEVRIVETEEKKLLRQSFVNKTAAIDYVREIGGDVLDEVRDLESLDAEWIEKLHSLEADPSLENIRSFAEGVLGIYVRVINNLFEFTALAYALSSLGAFLKENADAIIVDPKKVKTLVMLLEHLGEDLGSWREHIFMLQDTADIHYLDSSFFSSCMQIEGIIADKEVATDDDNDFEFF